MAAYKGDLLYAGKAKSVYQTDQEGTFLVEFRDDITAFDGGKKDVLSQKGSLNARVSAFLFNHLMERGIPTHYLSMVDDRSMLVRSLEMIPLEVIVRNIAAGSMVRNYPIAEGISLQPPVIVMDYKDDARHDPMLNDDLILALKILNADDLARIKEMAHSINTTLFSFFESLDITLVDFKIEFGRLDDQILLGDEISMDSMRLWDTRTGESLDKDVYRFSRGDVMEVYRRVAAKICTGNEKLSQERKEIFRPGTGGGERIMPEDDLELEILEWARKYAQQQHWVLNPDKKKLDIVIRGLARNQKKFGERYCPCRLRTGDPEKDKEIICPCAFHRDEVESDGSCHCNLYFR